MERNADILAVEPVGGSQMVLYTRNGVRSETFSPWLLVEAPEDCSRAGLSGVREIVPLRGGGEFRFLVRFQTWSDFMDARGRLSEDGISYFTFGSPVRQHLLLSGQTLFHDMRYNDIHRLQLDIETLSLDPQAPEAGIILVALSDNRGYEEVLSAQGASEADLLRALSRRIAECDPDVIEGHNLFGFDLPYIGARAGRHNVPLPWGRDERCAG